MSQKGSTMSQKGSTISKILRVFDGLCLKRSVDQKILDRIVSIHTRSHQMRDYHIYIDMKDHERF